jgi:hypothetical protein
MHMGLFLWWILLRSRSFNFFNYVRYYLHKPINDMAWQSEEWIGAAFEDLPTWSLTIVKELCHNLRGASQDLVLSRPNEKGIYNGYTPVPTTLYQGNWHWKWLPKLGIPFAVYVVIHVAWKHSWPCCPARNPLLPGTLHQDSITPFIHLQFLQL